MSTNDSVLFLCRHAPYGSSHAHETLDMAMAFAVFDRPVSMLFMGAGCLQLRNKTETEGSGVKNLAAALKALPLYEVTQLYCDAEALAHYQLSADELCLPVEAVSDHRMQELIAAHDLVLAV